MKFLEILDQIRSVLGKGAGAELAFGKATQVNDVTVIPVARISMAVGGGGGSSPTSYKKSKQASAVPVEETSEAPSQDVKPANEGGGGGGQVKTNPLGIYVIKGDKVKFFPLIGAREIVIATGLILLLLNRLLKPKSRKRIK